MKKEQLALMAKEAMKHSYSPYSGYRVGAALLCEDGSVYTGCNVENASFGATNCAERTAFYKAISEGKQAFSKDVADYLYAGMMNDTNCFTRRLSQKTMAIAQKLINYGADYMQIIKKTFSERTMYWFKALAKLF